MLIFSLFSLSFSLVQYPLTPRLISQAPSLQWAKGTPKCIANAKGLTCLRRRSQVQAFVIHGVMYYIQISLRLTASENVPVRFTHFHPIKLLLIKSTSQYFPNFYTFRKICQIIKYKDWKNIHSLWLLYSYAVKKYS